MIWILVALMYLCLAGFAFVVFKQSQITERMKQIREDIKKLRAEESRVFSIWAERDALSSKLIHIACRGVAVGHPLWNDFIEECDSLDAKLSEAVGDEKVKTLGPMIRGLCGQTKPEELDLPYPTSIN